MTTLFFFFYGKGGLLKISRESLTFIYIYIYLLLEYFTILNIKVTNLFDVSRHFFGIFFKIRTLKFAKRKNYRSVRRKAIVRLVRCREIVNTEADGELASNGTSTRYRSTYHIRPALKRRISVDTVGPNNGTTGLRTSVATSRLPRGRESSNLCCVIGPILPVKFFLFASYKLTTFLTQLESDL